MKKSVKRKDGRNSSTMRKFSVEVNVLERSHGSCRYSQGGTVVLVGVYGPIKENYLYQNPTKSTLKVNFNFVGFEKNKNRQYGVFICKTFSKYIMDSLFPQQRIMISIQVIKNEGSLLSCAINAAQFALFNAGISMVTTLVAVDVGVLEVNEKEKEDKMKSEEEEDGEEEKKIIVIDPLTDEEKVKTKMCFVFDGNKVDKGIISSFFYGDDIIKDESTLFECLSLAKKASKQIFSIIRLTTIKLQE